MKGYKTLTAAALVALTGFLASPEVLSWASDNAAWVTSGLGVLIAALRAATSSPVLKRE